MITWLTANISTILICLVLCAAAAGIIAVMIRDKKNGKSSCGGNCGHCPMGDSCRKH